MQNNDDAILKKIKEMGFNERPAPRPRPQMQPQIEFHGEKQRLFVDMDGTLAKFNQVDTLETLYEEGYFLNLEPIQNVLHAVKRLCRVKRDVEVYILSAVLTDSKYALQEKNEWLDKYLPEVPPERRIFPPCGEDKKEHIPGGIRGDDFLLDDYTNNLVLWQPPAKGIKLWNGINHTKGTWQGDMLSYKKPFPELSKDIYNVMKGKDHIVDMPENTQKQSALQRYAQNQEKE